MAEILKANSWEDAMNDNYEKVDVQETQTPEIVDTPTQEEVEAEDIPVVPTEEVEVKVETEQVQQPVIQEKIVEKIVEKYPEMDDYSKEILTALQEGKEDVLLAYLQEKFQDYNVMSDYDVVKESLKKTNKGWTDRDVDIELQLKYGKTFSKIDLDEIDDVNEPDKYDKAKKHNDEVEYKEMLLARDARDSRIQLNEAKKNVVLPKITTNQTEAPVQQPTAEEIAEMNQKWEAHVEAEIPKLSELKFKVGDEEVTYKVTDEEKAEQTSYMKNFTGEGIARELGWIDDKGNENVLKIAEDRLKLKNIDKIIASAITQTKTATKKEVIAKDIKNLDLEGKSTAQVKVVKSFADAALDA